MSARLNEVLQIVAKEASPQEDGGFELLGATVTPQHARRTLGDYIYGRFFCGMSGALPQRGRASGDSGFVSHLSSLTRGDCWQTGFRLVESKETSAWVSDGRIQLYLDEIGLYAPARAKVGDGVAVRLPRVRENLHPHRWTAFGGKGPAASSQPFLKVFFNTSVEGCLDMAKELSTKDAYYFSYSCYVLNEPRDFSRRDTVIFDVAAVDKEAFLVWLKGFAERKRKFVRNTLPLFAESVAPGISVATRTQPEDAAEAFGLRRSGWMADAILAAWASREFSPEMWRLRLTGLDV